MTNEFNRTSLTPFLSQRGPVLKFFCLPLFLSFLPNTESKKSKNPLGFPLESAHPGFHGSGFLAALHLTFIKNLTDETRLLLSFSVIIWFKEIKGLSKTKSRSWGKPRGGTPGGFEAVFPSAMPCGRVVFNKRK